MSQQTAIETYGVGNKLTPCFDKPAAIRKPVNLPPSVTYPGGQLLGQTGTAAVNDVQTITAPGSGTYTISGVNPLTGASFTTAALAFGANDAAILAALVAPLVSSPSPGLTAPTVFGTGSAGLTVVSAAVTFGGAMAGRPVQLMTVSAGSIAHTTVGQSAGTYSAYAGMLAAPTTAPTVAGAGSGSSYGAGTYGTCYTLVTAYGETTPSPVTEATVTAAQNLSVTSITGLNAAVTTVNFYVNGQLAKAVTPSAGATGTVSITGAAPTAGETPPTVNTAALTGKPTCFLEYPVTTDASGNINSSVLFPFQSQPATSAYFSGAFNTADLTGLDANAISAMAGRLASGTLSSGTFIF